jgi:hypothetical protein
MFHGHNCCVAAMRTSLTQTRLAQTSLALLCAVTLSSPAFAFRPFDGTDAAVAEHGEVEIELQPAGVQADPAQKTLLAPSIVFNYGFAENWEAVVQGNGAFPLSTSDPASLQGTGAFLKHVVREGSLQGKEGASIATEFGVLLPETHTEFGMGASLAGIVSERWDWGSVHLNVAATLTRTQHADGFVGAIVEGPAQWSVRPVAEVYYEKELGQTDTVSGLVGLIWRVLDHLDFDLAVRHALTNGRPVKEVRAGLTFGFSQSFQDWARQ